MCDSARIGSGTVKVLVAFSIVLAIVAGTAVYLLQRTADEEDSFVILAYPSFASYGLGPKAVELFKEVTGINVTVRTPGDVGTLIDVLNREKDDPSADIVIGIDNSLFHRALGLDLLEPYEARGIERIDPELVFDTTHHLTPFDYGYIAIICNEGMMDDEGLPYPDSILDLSDPVYRDQLLLLDPAGSSTGASFLAWSAMVAGEDLPEYLEGLSRNALNVFSSWDAMYTAFGNGEAAIAISYGLDTAYEINYYGKSSTKTIVPENEGYRQIEGAGIVKGAKHDREARMFLDLMLTDDFQELVGENVMLPVVTGIQVNSTYLRYGAFAKVHVEPDLATIDNGFDAWLQEWDRAFSD